MRWGRTGGAIRPKKPAAAEALLKRLHDPDKEFHAACREALVGSGAVLRLIGTAPKSEDAAHARAAAELLKKIDPGCRRAMPAGGRGEGRRPAGVRRRG